MPATLTLEHYGSINIKEKTQLNADSAAAAVSLVVQGSVNFAGNDYIVVGTLGAETCDLTTLSSVPDATHFTVPAMRLPHFRFDDVTSLFGNKLRVYRAANVDGTQPADGAFSLLTTIDIDYDQLTTSYTDAAGGSGYWYKFTHYNSTTTGETALADSVAARGGNASAYCSNDDIRQVAGYKNNPNITDSMINLKRLAAQDEINSTLVGRYTVPFAAPINPKIAELTKELAAAFLLMDDFGPFAANTTKDGAARAKEVRDYLQALKDGDKYLTDVNGNDISTAGAGSNVSSWPDETTRTLDEFDNNGIPVHGGDTMFNIKHQF